MKKEKYPLSQERIQNMNMMDVVEKIKAVVCHVIAAEMEKPVDVHPVLKQSNYPMANSLKPNTIVQTVHTII